MQISFSGLRLSSLAKSSLFIGLMAPTLLTGLDHHLFGVALPAIRQGFGIEADMAAWASMVYTLPFMALMPLYGSLGDGLGKRRLLIFGALIFLLGTALVFVSPSLGWFMVGRAIQGVGTAGFVPLCLAIIAESYAAEERGRMMGTWNSLIPFIGMSVPYFGGLLIDATSWRAIYPIIFGTGVLSLFLMQRNLPVRPSAPDPDFLRRFDWVGVGLLSGALVSLLFFTSSRPITGVAALQDWRLLGVCLLLFALLVLWERRRSQPYVNLTLFAKPTFTFASLCAGLRMFLMSAISFVTPLYLTDIHGLNASMVGVVLALQAGALFIVSRLGGTLADRWGSRIPAVVSMTGLVLLMIGLAYLPANAPVWLVASAATGHGLLIGISLAPLHRAAMHGIAPHESGSAAGMYSMLRFAGQILGTAMGGVTLQRWLTQTSMPITAYQNVFWMFAWVAVLATAMSWMLRDK